jgi:hypothetical protein
VRVPLRESETGQPVTLPHFDGAEKYFPQQSRIENPRHAQL